MSVYTMVSIGILGTVLTVTVRQLKPELGLFVGAAAGILILLMSAAELTGTLDALRSLASHYEIPTDYVGLLVKIIGITCLVQFGTQVCKDAGESAIASRVELGGRTLILAMTLPAAIEAIRAAASLLAETVP